MTAADAQAFAPAKVNLALHVTGLRNDGYHTLSSLVAFADIGDRVTARPAPDWSLDVSGPMADGVPSGCDNLILRAARLTRGPPAAFVLDKHLPMQAGIGGGTSDAAAALRALNRLDGRAPPDGPERIGADLPVCLRARAALVDGAGERVTVLPPLPPLHAVLANPRVALPTPRVFAALDRKRNPPLPDLPDAPDTADLIDWLAHQRNDLERPARAIAPVIGVLLSRLSTLPRCRLARMSGSGATSFGLFDTGADARAAAESLAQDRPDWWVRATTLA